MKLKLALAIIFIAGLASCTQKTCPTYSKNTVDTHHQTEVRS